MKKEGVVASGEGLVGFEVYGEKGGKLASEFYEGARFFLEYGGCMDRRENESSFFQVELMGKHTGLDFTDKQKMLYVYLRELPVRSRTEEEIRRNVSPWGLSDQELMAEVLLLTGDVDNCQEFKGFYSSIALPKCNS